MSRLEHVAEQCATVDHGPVVNDGSGHGKDFEVITKPSTLGWPWHGFETGTAEFLKQQRQAINDSGANLYPNPNLSPVGLRPMTKDRP